MVAARLNAPALEAPLLRRLRVRRMDGGLLDDPGLIAAAASDVGLDPDAVASWSASAAVEDALQEDVRRSRAPSAKARALDHKLGGPPEERRYSAPSYVLGGEVFIAGYNPVEAYEAALANLDPTLKRRGRPASVAELLAAFADEPLATAEIAAIMERDVRTELGRTARPIPAGADFYWSA